MADVAIASAIFAGILIVCLNAFIAMGKIYFKGSVEAKVQEASRGILDEIARTIATTGAEIEGPIRETPPGWISYCIAGVKYSFQQDKQLNRGGAVNNKVDQAFVKSIVRDSNGDPTGRCVGITPRPPNNRSHGVELLDYQMRVHDFSIETYGRLHVIKLTLIYGGDPNDDEYEGEVFEFRPDDNVHAFDDQTRCELRGTFCYIVRIHREVYQSISE